MATIKRIGFGQVEGNHLSAQRTAQIYAQLPAKDDIKILENGQFVKYDYANTAGKEGVVGHGVVTSDLTTDTTAAGEWMMVFNEVKLYDGWRETYKDFAQKKANYTDGVMVPRVIKTNIGDIYTTNCIGKANTDGKATVDTGIDDADIIGKFMVVDTETNKGYLKLATEETLSDITDAPVFQVIALTTMPDMQTAVKLMRVQ